MLRCMHTHTICAIVPFALCVAAIGAVLALFLVHSGVMKMPAQSMASGEEMSPRANKRVFWHQRID